VGEFGQRRLVHDGVRNLPTANASIDMGWMRRLDQTESLGQKACLIVELLLLEMNEVALVHARYRPGFR
jgi:hypothetical protein